MYRQKCCNNSTIVHFQCKFLGAIEKSAKFLHPTAQCAHVLVLYCLCITHGYEPEICKPKPDINILYSYIRSSCVRLCFNAEVSDLVLDSVCGPA